MTADFDFWRMLAGVGLFLFAMNVLEQALQSIGGRSLTRFLRRQTDRRIRAVFAGIAGTAFLQSSSVVSLMVLAFVGAGLFALPNALGVIFGSNLGTTLTGWIVATLGFRLDIAALALPLIGVSGVLIVLGRRGVNHVGQVLMGLGLLLLGLVFMKESVAALADSIDVGRLAGLSAWQYLLFGVVVAAVIQSSSATIMITLTALHADLLTLPNAAAVAIGADLGTTTTVMIGAVFGSAVKKQVATGHFVFNLVIAALAFTLLTPLLMAVRAVGLSDPLYALVAFHSLFNLIGLLIFVPLTVPFAGLLSRLFQARDVPASHYLSEVSPGVPEAAMQAIDHETAHLVGRAIRQNLLAFDPALPLPPGRLPVPYDLPANVRDQRGFEGLYARTKKLEGEILGFGVRLQGEPMAPDQSERLGQLLSAIREAIQSSKFLKDIRHNLADFRDADRAITSDYIDHFRSVMTSFYSAVFSLRGIGSESVSFEDLAELIQDVRVWHERLHAEIYADVSSGAVSQSEISSLLNVNREILNSNLALLRSLADYCLEPAQAQALMTLPGAG